MKKLAVVLIGLAAGLGVRAAAQGQVERFACVSCQTDYWDTGELYWCNLYTDSGLYVPDGTEPAWSPDGSRPVCSTGATGRCSVSRSGVSNQTASVTFAVSAVTHAVSLYTPAANHDPDGDSNGTRITVRKP